MLVQVNLYLTRSVFLCKMLPFLNMGLKMIVIYVDEAQLYRLRPFKMSAQSLLSNTVRFYFCQVLLDMLSHSAAVLSALARHPVSTGKELMSAVETFIFELLNLTKDSILEAKVTAFPFSPFNILHMKTL